MVDPGDWMDSLKCRQIYLLHKINKSKCKKWKRKWRKKWCVVTTFTSLNYSSEPESVIFCLNLFSEPRPKTATLESLTLRRGLDVTYLRMTSVNSTQISTFCLSVI